MSNKSSCCGESAVIESVKEYYGKQIRSIKDLQSGACCTESPPEEVRATLPLIADEIKEKFYGCGSPLPPLLRSMTVLDLGCGTGRDVYVASRLVGERGQVIGVDMTEEQIKIAMKYQEEQRERFGYDRSNVTFKLGYIEDLKSLGIEDNSIDVVISNCVINLSPNKEQVFREIYRVLKPGGELFFSDVFADRRIPEDLVDDPVLRAECISGAFYVEDFRRLMTIAGWADFRYTSIREFTLNNENMKRKIGFVNFTSRTVRAFKLNDLEDICEDYGQVAFYNGRIPGHLHYFDLDDHHRFFTNQPMLVCGNTSSMISNTRFGKVFKVTERTGHFGKFDACGTPAIETKLTDAGTASNCC
jgi:ubiquinone/menaquinone biosynthesis C-methylase UbiE